MDTYISATDKQAFFLIRRELSHPSSQSDVTKPDVLDKAFLIADHDTESDDARLSLEFLSVPRTKNGTLRTAKDGQRLFARYVVSQEQIGAFCGRFPEKSQAVFDMLHDMWSSKSGPLTHPAGICDASGGLISRRRPGSVLFSEATKPDLSNGFDIDSYAKSHTAVIADFVKDANHMLVPPSYKKVAFMLDQSPSFLPHDVPCSLLPDRVEKVASVTGIRPVDGMYKEGLRFTPFIACDDKVITKGIDKAKRPYHTSRTTFANPYIFNYRTSSETRHDIVLPPDKACDLLEHGKWILKEDGPGTSYYEGVIMTMLSAKMQHPASKGEYYASTQMMSADDVCAVYAVKPRRPRPGASRLNFDVMNGYYTDMRPCYNTLHEALKKHFDKGIVPDVMIPSDSDAKALRNFEAMMGYISFDRKAHDLYVKTVSRELANRQKKADNLLPDDQDDDSVPFMADEPFAF